VRAAGGSITAFYTVLVEGDDINDPISDAVRSILDGHLSLSRALASRGQLPAIDTSNSVSRLIRQLVHEDDLGVARQVLKLLSVYQASRDLIDVGAYRTGTNPELDRAVRIAPALDQFMTQPPGVSVRRQPALQQLRSILGRDT
jgi:flagellum-specific ATP synthase